MTDVFTILYTGISNFDSQLYFAVKKFKAYSNDISVFILNNYENKDQDVLPQETFR